MESVTKKRTGDYEIVRDHVLAEYRTGDKLPAEEELAKSLGVTKYAALRALTELSANGVIRREKGRGSVVIGAGHSSKAATFRNIAYLAADFESFMHVEILRGIDEFTRGENYRISLLNSNYDPVIEMSNIATIEEGGYCGVIAVLCNDTHSLQKIEALHKKGLPVVQVDRHSEQLSSPWVESDHEAGAYAAVKYLIGLGHKRIAHITFNTDIESAVVRERGYRRALADAGLPIREEYIQYSQLLSSVRAIVPEVYSSIAYEPMHKLLALPEPPTAVFLLNDCFASGALQAIVNHGLSVPNDISLVGFDDGPEARLMSVPLTTVAQPFRQIGSKAAEMLDKLVSGQPLREDSLQLPTRLVIRSSTRPPRS